MKTRSTVLISTLTLALGLTATITVRAAAKSDRAGDGRVEIVFQSPEKFTDVKDSAMETDKGRDSILDEIKRFIEQRAGDLLPAERKLVLTFTEIDLAGEYEPWRTPPLNDVRIVKSLYSPRMDFNFKVTDAKSGAVLKEGKAELRDMAFQQRLTINRDDPYRYEKDMLDSWMRENLRAPKAEKK